MEKKLKIIVALLRLTPSIVAVIKAQKHGTDAEQDAAVGVLVDKVCDEAKKLYPEVEEYEEVFKQVVLALYNTFDD